MQTEKHISFELKTNNIMLIICLNKLCYLTVFLLKLSQHISTETKFFFLSTTPQQNTILLNLQNLIQAL